MAELARLLLKGSNGLDVLKKILNICEHVLYALAELLLITAFSFRRRKTGSPKMEISPINIKLEYPSEEINC